MGSGDSQRRSFIARRGRGRLAWAVAAVALLGGGAAFIDWDSGEQRRPEATRPPVVAEAPGARSRAAAKEPLSGVVAVEVDGRGVTASGFRVGVDRVVVTNAHTVRDAEEVSVVLRDGSRRTAQVLGRSPEFDIAALELATDAGLAPLHSGSGLADLRVGDRVLAAGSAGRVAAGVVTGLSRRVRTRDGTEFGAVQTDIVIDSSYAGGPLLNTRGDVVGVSTVIMTPIEDASARVGIAIPVDVAKREALAIVDGD